MATEPQSVTSLEVAPEQERRGRMLRYSLAMTIRFVCVILSVVLHGWLMWVAIAGAVFLPYFAVVLANNVGSAGTKTKPATSVSAPTISIGADAFVNASSAAKD